MVYRVLPDGSVEADSLDEALALSQRMVGHNGDRPKAAPKLPDWAGFVESLTTDHRKVLEIIKRRQEIELAALAKELRKPTSSLSGWLTAIKRRARKAGLAPTAIMTNEVKGYGPKRQSIYRSGDLLMQHEI